MVIVVIVLITVFFIPFVHGAQKNTGVKFDNSSQSPKAYKQSYITLQGMSEVKFKAGTKIQEFEFLNVESNKCTMDIVFTMPDGEVLFEAHDIKPSFGLKEVTLNRTLEAGTYEDCNIEVECFSIGNKSRINGAIMNVTLFVE